MSWLSHSQLREAVVAERRRLHSLEGQDRLYLPTLTPEGASTLLALLCMEGTTTLLSGSNPLLRASLRRQFAHLPEVHTPPASAHQRGCVAVQLPGYPSLEPVGKIILCSSGTTGEPKRLLLTAQALWTSAQSVTRGWNPRPVVALQLPLWHVAGLALLIRGWITEADWVIAPPAQWPGTVRPITHLSVVPSQLSRWWRELPAAQLRKWGQPLQQVLVGGGPCPDALLCHPLANEWPLQLSFAMTEAGSTVAMTPPGDPTAPFEGLPHLQWREESGCLALAGPSMASALYQEGQWKDLCDAEGWWRSSDAIRVEDTHRFRWVGRTDRILISGGEKLDPVRMERWIEQQGAQRAWVVAVPDPVWGERPIGFVAHSPIPLDQLLQRMQSCWGRRYCPDRLVSLPPDLIDLDKVPTQALMSLWTRRSCSTEC